MARHAMHTMTAARKHAAASTAVYTTSGEVTWCEDAQFSADLLYREQAVEVQQLRQLAGLPRPYYVDEAVTLYHGDALALLPLLPKADAVVTDPPYGETSLDWDVWPDGWPDVAALVAPQVWCFGSTRMFLDKGHQFRAWKLAQDVVWEKHNGSNNANDRFRRLHELALHFYRGEWGTCSRRRSSPTTPRPARCGARPGRRTGATLDRAATCCGKQRPAKDCVVQSYYDGLSIWCAPEKGCKDPQVIAARKAREFANRSTGQKARWAKASNDQHKAQRFLLSP